MAAATAVDWLLQGSRNSSSTTPMQPHALTMSLPFKAEHQVAWIVAGCFALLSTCLTFYQVSMHIRYNCQPESRRFVIRILLMVPIYALESWLGLRFASITLYFDLLRECYEAFVIYSFYQLLISALGGERKLVALLAKKEPMPHAFPFCCLPKWRMSDRFYIKFSQGELERLQAAVEKRQKERAEKAATTALLPAGAAAERKEALDASAVELGQATAANPSPDFSAAASSPRAVRPMDAPPVPKPAAAPKMPASYLSPYSRPHHSDFLTHTQLGTLQYCIAKPVTALLAFILSLLDLYGESTFDFASGYPYLAFITNMSQIWAMYCLILFYVRMKEELAPLRPIPKFLCVKAVVFFTFWQSVLIAGLAQMGVLHDTRNFTQAEIVGALQDFIVCLEMLFAALAHHYAFNWRQWHDEALLTSAVQGGRPMLSSLLEALNVTDVYVQDVVRVTSRSTRTGTRANPQITQEEFHERQYASFVAAQEGRVHTGDSGERAVTVLLNGAADLTAPLNPEGEEDSADTGESSSYRAPSGGAGNDENGSTVPPLLSSRSFARVLLVTDRDVVREVDAQGHVLSTHATVVSEEARVRPLTPTQAREELRQHPGKHAHFSGHASHGQGHQGDPELLAPSVDSAVPVAAVVQALSREQHPEAE